MTDDGPGLSDAEQRLLFQPFERLGAERSHVQGTGLGLALCRQLTAAMGGSIGLRSVKGEGATFSVRLQRASSTDTAALIRASAPAVLRNVVAECTVLYVEDNLATVALVESIFALRPTVRLLTAMQGGMAVELAREQHPDLVILDLHLPDINGEEVIHRLRDNPRTAHVPVVIYSADATERQVDRLLAAGAEAYLTKPARVAEFLGLIDRILGRSAHAAEAAARSRADQHGRSTVRLALRRQPQCRRRAGGDRLPGQLEELSAHRSAVDDGVAPVIEGDPLGEELGAHPVGVAADRVDADLAAHRR